MSPKRTITLETKIAEVIAKEEKVKSRQEAFDDFIGAATANAGLTVQRLEEINRSTPMPFRWEDPTMSSDTNPAAHLDIDVKSEPGNRSPQKLIEVVTALRLETRPRYKVRDIDADGDMDTFCNIAIWDWSRAMGREIPHWVDAAGNPSSKDNKGHELSASGVCDWLENVGLHHGWRRVDQLEANLLASRGFAVCVTWRNPVHGQSSHVAVVLPPDKGYTMIAQAGSRNSSRMTLSHGFGTRPVKYWAAI